MRQSQSTDLLTPSLPQGDLPTVHSWYTTHRSSALSGAPLAVLHPCLWPPSLWMYLGRWASTQPSDASTYRQLQETQCVYIDEHSPHVGDDGADSKDEKKTQYDHECSHLSRRDVLAMSFLVVLIRHQYYWNKYHTEGKQRSHRFQDSTEPAPPIDTFSCTGNPKE